MHRIKPPSLEPALSKYYMILPILRTAPTFFQDLILGRRILSWSRFAPSASIMSSERIIPQWSTVSAYLTWAYWRYGTRLFGMKSWNFLTAIDNVICWTLVLFRQHCKASWKAGALVTFYKNAPVVSVVAGSSLAGELNSPIIYPVFYIHIKLVTNIATQKAIRSKDLSFQSNFLAFGVVASHTYSYTFHRQELKAREDTWCRLEKSY